MGRPSASDVNKNIGLLFSDAVTEDTQNRNWPSFQIVDRTGRLSLFEALTAFVPSVIRDTTSQSGRNGLTRIEFNKYLEKNGFFKARSKSPYDEDQEESRGKQVQGVRYYFVYRRWLNPEDAADRKVLESKWVILQETLAAMNESVTQSNFLSICKTYHDQWKAELMKKRCNRPSLDKNTARLSEHDHLSTPECNESREASECHFSTTADQDLHDFSGLAEQTCFQHKKRRLNQISSSDSHQQENSDFSLSAWDDIQIELPQDNTQNYAFFPESMPLCAADIEAVVGPCTLQNPHGSSFGSEFDLIFQY